MGIVNYTIVETGEGQMRLSDGQVFIVARVTDDCAMCIDRPIFIQKELFEVARKIIDPAGIKISFFYQAAQPKDVSPFIIWRNLILALDKRIGSDAKFCPECRVAQQLTDCEFLGELSLKNRPAI